MAIVTGGGRGRGVAALALGAAGASVVVGGRTQEPLDETVELLASVLRRGTRRGGRRDRAGGHRAPRRPRTVERFGTVDILVNNAQGPHGHGRLLDVDDALYEVGFRSGPQVTFRMMRACHPHLRGGGVIVNLGTGSNTS